MELGYTTYPYDNGTNIFIYKFFNNEQYGILDQADVNRPYSQAPLKSFTQVYSEQNVLIDGNILEGFDNFDADQLALPTVTVNYAEYAALTLTLDVSLRWTIVAAEPITIDVHLVDVQTNIDTIDDSQRIEDSDPDSFVCQTVIDNIEYGDRVYLTLDGSGDSIEANSTLKGKYSNS